MRAVHTFFRFAIGGVRLALASVAGGGLVLGIPYLLVRFVGNPIPDRLPVWDEVILSLQSRELDDSVVVQILALVIWVVWAQLLISLLVEVRAALQGVKTSAIRGFGATQWLARRIVAQFTLASTLFVQSAAGVALPPMPALAEVVPAELVVDQETLGPVVETVAPESQPGFEISVDPTDTLWDLAEEHLGSGGRWAEIRDANVGRRMADGTLLGRDFVTIDGDWALLVPTAHRATDATSEAVASSADGTVIGAWRVQPGDHFWMMAETVLTEGWGRAPTEEEIRGYWLDIIAHNRDHLISPGNDPNLIYADQSFEILLPPLPVDAMSADDALATTTPHPLDGIEQFTPVTPVPGPVSGSVEVHPEPAVEGDEEGADETEREPVVSVAGGTGSEDEATDRADGRQTVAGPDPDSGDLGVRLPGAGLTTTGIAAIGLTTIAAAFVLNTLRARRRIQAAQRRPGSEPNLPDEFHREFEARIRAIADHEALRWLSAVNKYLSHTLDESPSTWRLPAIVAIRAGEYGVEVLLDEDGAPPTGFIAGNQPRTWVLDPDIEIRQLEAEARDRLPFAPMLLPVGGTTAGELLIELGQLGVVSLDGPEQAIVGWLRSLAVAVANSPWSERVRVVAMGVDPILGRMPHVEVPDDPFEWSRTEADRRRSQGPISESRYEQRLGGREVDETLVLVGPGFEGVAQHLVGVAELVNTPLTLVAAAPVPGEARIQFEGDACTLEPKGLTFWPAVMEAEAIAMTTTLLDGASETSTIPDEFLYPTSPPPPRVEPAAVADPDPRVHSNTAGRPPASSAPAQEAEDFAGAQRRSFGDSGAGNGQHEADEEPPDPIAPSIGDSTLPPQPGRRSGSDMDGGEQFGDFYDATSDPPGAFETTSNEFAEAIGPTPTEERLSGRLDDSGEDDEQGTLFEQARMEEVARTGRLFRPEDQAGAAGSDDSTEAGRQSIRTTASDRSALEPEAETGDVISVAGVDPGSARDLALGESPSASAAVAEVLEVQPIEVAVLTEIPSIEGTSERLTPKNQSVLAYLAFHRSVTSTTLRNVFWPRSVNRSTGDNAISLIRGQVGLDSQGEPRLLAASGGRFSVSDEVGCDWSRFTRLVELAGEARSKGTPADEMAFLRAALRLVTGAIASGVDAKKWQWLRDDPMVYSQIETAIVDAAHRLGSQACDQQLAELALWAAEKGLMVVPDQEALYRIQMSAAAIAGDEHAVSSVFRRAQRSVQDQPHGDGVQPETEHLYRRLVGHTANAESVRSEGSA